MKEIDRELVFQSADDAAADDIIAAKNAIEKMRTVEDYRTAEREYFFFTVRAAYRYLQRMNGQAEASRYLTEQQKVRGDDLAHILENTTPYFD